MFVWYTNINEHLVFQNGYKFVFRVQEQLPQYADHSVSMFITVYISHSRVCISIKNTQAIQRRMHSIVLQSEYIYSIDKFLKPRAPETINS
jgi:hypothetical protein